MSRVVEFSFLRPEFRHSVEAAAKAFEQQLTYFWNHYRIRPEAWEWSEDTLLLTMTNGKTMAVPVFWRDKDGSKDRHLYLEERIVFEQPVLDMVKADPRLWSPRKRPRGV